MHSIVYLPHKDNDNAFYKINSRSNDFKTIMGDYINQSYTISSSFDGRDINGNPYEVDINGKPILIVVIFIFAEDSL